MHIAIVTAGGAGMFCGSCMHDNTWARSLIDAGADVSLVPTYTPIRVDEQDVSGSDVYFGGVGVYLAHRSRLFRRLPRVLTRWIDRPWALKLATRFHVSTDAKQLGALTLDMLRGEDGPHRSHVLELADAFSSSLKPDLICFSNALLAGTAKAIRQQIDIPLLCVLQGDDVFLEDLVEPYRSRAIEAIHERAADFDGFIVHSDYYRDHMVRYLGLDARKFHTLPLGIDLASHDGEPGQTQTSQTPDDDPFTIGYFARICPEKGLDRLLEAFRILHARRPNVRLKAGGYLGHRDREFFNTLQAEAADLGDAFQYIGSPPDTAAKIEFLKSLDVLSVPTSYREPKGLYVLEALANGVPVVQPGHGAFPELIEATGGGLLVEPGHANALADALEALANDPVRRIELATTGQKKVRELFGPGRMAEKSLELFERMVASYHSGN